MRRVYVLDTSAIVDAWRDWYTPASHPDFWAFIVDACKAGHIVIPSEVFDELRPTGKGDSLGHWMASARNELETVSGPAEQAVVGRLMSDYRGLGGQATGEKDFADPFVVAHAVNRVDVDVAPTVVTHEVLAKKTAPMKIPNACAGEGILVRKIHVLVKEFGLSFVRRPPPERRDPPESPNQPLFV